MFEAISNIGHRLGVFRQAFEFLGISLWIAWVLLVFSGEFYVGTDNVYLHTTLCYLVSTVCVSIVFLLAGIMHARVGRLAFDNRACIAGGLAASVGTIGVMLIGKPVGLFVLLVVSAALAGTGTGVVALRGCLAMGELSARNSFFVSGATLLQAFVIYLAILALPLEVGMALLTLLPFMAGVHLCFHRIGEPLPLYREAGGLVRAPLWRMTAALFILAIVFSLSRGMYPSGLDISDFNDTRNYAALGSMAFCMAMLLLSLVLPQGTSFGQLGYWMVVAIIFLTALFPILGLSSSVSGVASTIANSALGVTAWALFGAMASLSRISPLRVYGLGFSAFMLGSAVGWPIGFVANIESLGAAQYYVGFGLLLAVFLVVLTLFRQSDLVKLTTEAEPDEMPASSNPAMAEDLENAPAPVGVDSIGPLSQLREAMESLPTDQPAREARLADLGASTNSVDDAARFEPEEGADLRPKSWKARMRLIAEQHMLTERETEVFLLLAKGLNARTVSDALGFSYNTARVHVRNIYAKLDVHSRDELLKLVQDTAKEP